MIHTTLTSPLLYLVSAELKREAIQQENRWANILMRLLQKEQEETGSTEPLIKAINPQQFLKDFFTQALNYTKGPKISKFDYTKTGNFKIYPPITYEINGTTKKLSQERINIINNEVKSMQKNNPYVDNIQDIDNFENRLAGFIWEEIGETVVNQNLNKMLNQRPDGVISLFKQSKDWRVDSVATAYVLYKETSNNIEYDIADQAQIYLEHKTNVEHFHFGDGLVTLNDTNLPYFKQITKNLDSIYIPDLYKAAFLRERIKGLYPVYYSVQNQKVLLSSEILSKPEGFYLTKPPEYSEAEIDNMANKIWEDLSKKTESKNNTSHIDYTRDFGKNLREEYSLEKEIFDMLSKVTQNVSMWYSYK